MVLTPMDIHNKEFKKSFRGYNDAEVDIFLDEIIVDFEKLYRENLDLKEKVKFLNDQINTYKTMENTLKETLLTAQKTADEVVELANQKADAIAKEAEESSIKIIKDANNKIFEIKKEYEDYKKQIHLYKVANLSLLETQKELLSRELPEYVDIDNEENISD